MTYKFVNVIYSLYLVFLGDSRERNTIMHVWTKAYFKNRLPRLNAKGETFGVELYVEGIQ